MQARRASPDADSMASGGDGWPDTTARLEGHASFRTDPNSGTYSIKDLNELACVIAGRAYVYQVHKRRGPAIVR